MLILCYNSATHDVEVDRDGVKSTVTIAVARELFESEQVDDCTLSWHRLVMTDYDPEAVDEFYRESDRDCGISTGDLARDAKDPHDIGS